MLSTRRWTGLCAALLALGAARADSPWLYGIHWYGDPAGSQVEAMSAGKGIWTLETVIVYSDPWWQAGGQLHKFQQAVARGHAIICRVQPNWGLAVGKDPQYPLAQYLTDLVATVDALKDVCHVWQVGNEQNLYDEYGGDLLTATAYVDQFTQIRAAIRSVASPLGDQVVLLGPVSPGPVIGGVRHTDGNVYLDQMCAALSPGDLDGFAIHAYASPALGPKLARDELQAGYAAQLAIIDAHGFAELPVHITEWNRRVATLSDPQYEAQSAKFLKGAFADLHAWNQTPGNHPVTSACWFIYDDSPGWENYSILHMRGVGPAGPDNDLWDAFQFAAQQDYPAGIPGPAGDPLMQPGPPPGVNRAPTAVDVTTDSQFDAANSGWEAVDGIIAAGDKWTSAGTAPPHWLELDLGTLVPLAGMIVHHAGAGGESQAFNTEAFQLQTRANPADDWAVDANEFNPQTFDSTARRYVAPRFARYVRLFITDPGVDSYARIPEFEVYSATPGDFDQDGDIDLADAAALQCCFGTCAADPACFFAHQDGDMTLDQADATAFLTQLAGPQP